MTAYQLVLAPENLAPLNANDRLHWAAKSVRTAAWRSHAAAAASQAEIPALQRAHITAYVSLTTNRRSDAHNWYPTAKACVDGLVDAGVIPDDRDEYLLGPDMRRTHKAERFTIRFQIEEVA